MEANIIPMKKSKVTKIKEHVIRHRGKYIGGTIAIAMGAFHVSATKEFYAFLKSKGIDPMEYYCPEAYAELKAFGQ